MSIIFEDRLAHLQMSWAEFCNTPYEALHEIKNDRILYCKRKEGFFIFDSEIVQEILLNDTRFKKRFSPPPSSTKVANDFFGKWLFFREDPEREQIKKELFKILASANDPLELEIKSAHESLNELFLDVRRSFFGHLLRLFFYIDESRLDFYFNHAEAIFSFFQSDRNCAETDIDENIRSIKMLYLEKRRIDFSAEFFDCAVLNVIVDGYEPLSDLCWNTINVSLSKDGMDPSIAYRIALSIVPSFRYVVRYMDDEIVVGGKYAIKDKVYCFLSAQSLTYDSSVLASPLLSFGRGKHICVGRGLSDFLIPKMVEHILGTLRNQNVGMIHLARADGLGAEGIQSITYFQK